MGFHDVCRLHRQGSTYYVVPSLVPPSSCASAAMPPAPTFSCLSTTPMQATMPQLLAPPAMSPPQMHSVSSVAPPPTLPPVLQAGLAPFVGIDCSQHEDSDASTTDGCPEDCASSDDLACFLHNSSSDFEDSPFLRSGGFSDMLTHAADEGASACIDSFDENVTSKACDIIRNTFIHFAEPKLPQHGARH